MKKNKYDTFQKQFELLDDVPCMAATFEFLVSRETRDKNKKLNSFCKNAIWSGFVWFESCNGHEYWYKQADLLYKRLYQ